MTLMVAVLGAMLFAAGVVILAATAAGVLVSTPSKPSSTGLWTQAVDKVRSLSRRTRVLVLAGAFGGVAVAVWTQWPLMLVVVPLAAIGIPHLLSAPPQTQIELLQALDRWVRSLTATMSTGKSITDALRLSARTAPPMLADHLVLLVRRLDDRWSTPDALLALADDLGSPDADAVLAALVLAAERGGNGASATLAALADTIQDRLKALREIEAERSKPRVVVKQVTIVTLVLLGGSMLLARDFFAPYGTPMGQVILGVLLACYVGSLIMLRRMTLPRERDRILRGTS
ncbi:MAG: type II secretion system F family protein [Propionibacteriaceae bacterium]|nr:type II secretion system F family protein [Propionibacteriaceae bacterium]